MFLETSFCIAGAGARSLKTFCVPASLRLAVLAPHPDDFDAMGATLDFFKKNGNLIEVAILTGGASGVEDGFGGAYTPDAKAAIREAEQRASCAFFGLPAPCLICLRLTEDSEGHPADTAENLDVVRKWLAAEQPDLVFLPHGNDPNTGHRRAYSFFQQGVRQAALTLVACLSRDPKTIAMRDDLFLAFHLETGAWKAELLRHHQSQHHRNLHQRGYGFDERILSVNRKIAAALQTGSPYAESFQLERYRHGQLLTP